MSADTYTDKCGQVIDRSAAINEAVYTILHQGDAGDIVREYVQGLTDAELMFWLVYPDTGEFSEHLHVTGGGQEGAK